MTTPMSVTIPSDREIVITRAFNAPRRLVFEAWTNPEYLPEWMIGPDGWKMTACEVDLRLGGVWACSWTDAEGASFTIKGEYREIDPPARLVYTEIWGDPWPESLSIMDLTEQDGVTTMVDTLVYPTKEARDAALKKGMNDGMEATFARLDEHLAPVA